MRVGHAILRRLALVVLVIGLLIPLSTASVMAQASPDELEEASLSGDRDDDFILDDRDNCVDVLNTTQIDWDGDGSGNACDETPRGADLDQDDDLVDDADDSCPADANTDQMDADGDGIGDACDAMPDGEPVAPDEGGGANDDDTAEGEGDSSPQPEAEESEPPPAQVDVKIDVTPDNGLVAVGDPISFTVTVIVKVGLGIPPPLTSFGGTAVLPKNDGLSWTLGDTDGACALTLAWGTLDCGGETFPPQPTYGYSATITSPTTAVHCGTISIKADVSGFGTRLEDTGSVTVQCPQVSIVKTPLAPEVAAGHDIGFAITVTNSGHGPGSGIAWSDTLPVVPGQTWTVAEQDPASPKCTLTAGGTVACAGISLERDGGSYTVRVESPTSATAESCGTYSSEATLTAGGTGSASASVTVICSGSVAIEVTPDGGTATAGGDVSFTVKVTNISPETIRDDVTLADTLPTNAGLVWTLGAHNFASCQITDGKLGCSFAQLLAGESRSVTVTSPTTPQTCGTVSNVATLLIDEVTAGSDSGSITVTCPQPTLTRAAADPHVAVGEPIGFVLTATNNGDQPIHAVAFSHDLPDGFAWTLASGAEACAIAGGVLDCARERLDPGESIWIGIMAPTSVAEHCAGAVNVVTLGTPGSEDAATVSIHCDVAPAPEPAPPVSQAAVVTQLPSTGTGGGYTTDLGWLLVLLASLVCCGAGVIARYRREATTPR